MHAFDGGNVDTVWRAGFPLKALEMRVGGTGLQTGSGCLAVF